MDLTITIFSLYFVKILKILSWTVHGQIIVMDGVHVFVYNI